MLLQKEIKTALLATNYSSMQEWLQAMLSDDTDCDLVGVIGLRMLTNVTIYLFLCIIQFTSSSILH